MEEIDGFETKIKNIKELIIDTIEHDYSKLIGNLNMRKGFEIKQEKTKNIQNNSWYNQKTVIPDKCCHHISRNRRFY